MEDSYIDQLEYFIYLDGLIGTRRLVDVDDRTRRVQIL